MEIIKSLNEAKSLLDSVKLPPVDTGGSEHSISDSGASGLSLLEQCMSLCEPSVDEAGGVVRTVHHMACTGGSVISKCIGALPNVCLLSEVNPFAYYHLKNSNKPKFSPSDLVVLSRYASIPDINPLIENLFSSQMKVLTDHCYRFGKSLVLRDHTHTDYMVGEHAEERKRFRDILQENYRVLSVVTVRHPLESYFSLMSNGWEQYQPKGVDEYCSRYEQFLDDYAGVSVYKYEDFTANPKNSIARISASLELEFSDVFLDVFGVIPITGDSGRSSDQIRARDVKQGVKDLSLKARKNDKYLKLCDRLGYSPIFN